MRLLSFKQKMKERGVMVNLHSLQTVELEGVSPFSLEYSLSFPVELRFFPYLLLAQYGNSHFSLQIKTF